MSRKQETTGHGAENSQPYNGNGKAHRTEKRDYRTRDGTSEPQLKEEKRRQIRQKRRIKNLPSLRNQ